jgi:hypothetical protein
MLAHEASTSGPLMQHDLQAKVDLMLQGIMTTIVKRVREHRERLETQRQFNELVAKYYGLIHKLETQGTPPEPRPAGSHHSQGAIVARE